MLAGSSVVASWHGVGKAASTKKAYASYRGQHEQLIADGAIAVEAGSGFHWSFPDASLFSSTTSGAGAIGVSCPP